MAPRKSIGKTKYGCKDLQPLSAHPSKYYHLKKDCWTKSNDEYISFRRLSSRKKPSVYCRSF
uniref:AlNc14C24G2438 protein n=1 Tax=Albugo laibachii Nc14 TaxID=890382 RepID=F0W6D8_9STRA|nr:AlNc14C24G2438 [Albugo laibachii Nc14]|eukprot:CCA16682.1 AlNc14C24G2438 [Albugo laibachii Nc14]